MITYNVRPLWIDAYEWVNSHDFDDLDIYCAYYGRIPDGYGVYEHEDESFFDYWLEDFPTHVEAYAYIAELSVQ